MVITDFSLLLAVTALCYSQCLTMEILSGAESLLCFKSV